MRRRGLRARTPGRARPGEPLADWCEAMTRVCTGRAHQRHHVKLRKQGGGDEKENTLDVCAACHSFIHANVAMAYERGWLKRSTA